MQIQPETYGVTQWMVRSGVQKLGEYERSNLAEISAAHYRRVSEGIEELRLTRFQDRNTLLPQGLANDISEMLLPGGIQLTALDGCCWEM